jgi:hypothetical protein
VGKFPVCQNGWQRKVFFGYFHVGFCHRIHGTESWEG